MNTKAPHRLDTLSAGSPSLRTAIAGVATLFVLAMATGSRADGTGKRVETFNLSPNGVVKVENYRGSVRVEVWNQPTVQVTADKTDPKDGPLSPSDLVLMSINGNVTVECKQNGKPDRIDLTLYVPRHAHVKVTGGAFPVDVIGSLMSSVVETSSGDIGYRVPPTDDARIVMHSAKGVVRSSVTINVDQKVGLRSLEGTLGDGSCPIILDSKSGNITLMAAASSRGVSAVITGEDGQLRVEPGSRAHAARPQDQASSQSSRGSNASAAQDSADETAANNGNPDYSDPNSIAAPPIRGRNSSSNNSRRNNGPLAGSGGNAQGGSGHAAPSIPSSGGDMSIAGDGQSVENSSITMTGPIPHPRKQSDTSEDNTGLRVRIIPADSTSGGAGDPRYPNQKAYDRIYSPDDPSPDAQADQSGQTGTGSSSGRQGTNQYGGSGAGGAGRPYTRPAGAPATNDEFVFAGGTQANQSSSITMTGPIPHPMKRDDTGEDTMGLKVRIIPSDSTAGGAGDPRYPNQKYRDDIDSQGDSQSPEAGSQSSSRRGGGTSGAGQYDQSGAEEPDSPSGSRGASSRPNVSGGRDVAAPGDLSANGDAEPGPSPERASSRGRRPRTEEGSIVLESALVSFNVAVTDRAGKSLTTLKKEDFTVYENNEEQKVAFFSPSTAPFNLVLLLDLSGSISEKIEVVKAAAIHFLDVLGPEDKVAVVTFTREPMVISELTNDRNLLRRRIKAITKPAGGTAFYEAVWFTLVETLRGTAGQRNAVVIMSDGVDNSLDRFNPANSRVSFPQLARKLEASDSIVFPIYVDTEYEEVFKNGNTTSEAYAIARQQLEQMAEITGGEMFKAQQIEDLAGIYSQVADVLRTVYSVGYYPTNPLHDGRFHRVAVNVDQADAIVRARKGYFAK